MADWSERCMYYSDDKILKSSKKYIYSFKWFRIIRTFNNLFFLLSKKMYAKNLVSIDLNIHLLKVTVAAIGAFSAAIRASSRLLYLKLKWVLILGKNYLCLSVRNTQSLSLWLLSVSSLKLVFRWSLRSV